MTEHFRSNLVGQTIQWWCKTCGRETPHRVDAVSTHNPGGVLGPCLMPHAPQFSKEQLKRRERLQRERQQPSLFDFSPQRKEVATNNGPKPQELP